MARPKTVVSELDKLLDAIRATKLAPMFTARERGEYLLRCFEAVSRLDVGVPDMPIGSAPGAEPGTGSAPGAGEKPLKRAA